MRSSFPDSALAVDVLEVLRFDGPRSARLKLNDYTSSCTFGPLLRELYLRLNGYSGPHLVIDTIWFVQKYGGISRVWSSILDTFRISGLFPSSSPLSLIYRKNCLIDVDFFNIFHASEVNPFDYNSYPLVSLENSSLLRSLNQPVFCSTWITSTGPKPSFPELAVVHDLIPEIYGVSDPLYLDLRHRYLSLASSVLAVSSHTSSHYSSRFIPRSPVQWCHPPLPSLSSISCDSFDINFIWNDLRSNFGTAQGYFYLPSSAGLGTYKNPDVLLKALRDPRLLHYDLIVSGSGSLSLRDQIKQHFPDLIKRVHFAGFTDLELVAVYKNVVCVVVPSLIEGFGLPVVEALSLGCPALISDSPGLVEAGLGSA